MPNEVRYRTRKQISFEKLCEVVDYEEEFSAENKFANGRARSKSLRSAAAAGSVRMTPLID
jgi:hypothetical protein